MTQKQVAIFIDLLAAAQLGVKIIREMTEIPDGYKDEYGIEVQSIKQMDKAIASTQKELYHD